MKTLPANQRVAKPCSPPVLVWQTLLTHLLEQHYGLTLNETPFSNKDVIQQHIDAAIPLADALSFIIEKYELGRTDCVSFRTQEKSLFDLLMSRKSTAPIKQT